MDDLKDIQAEASYHTGREGELVSELASQEESQEEHPTATSIQSVEASYHADREGELVSELAPQEEPKVDPVEVPDLAPFTISQEESPTTTNIWNSLEADLEKEIDSSEFTAGISSNSEGESAFDLPDGFGDLGNLPSSGEGSYQGPSLGGGYQSPDDILNSIAIPTSEKEKTVSILSAVPSAEDKTVSIQQDLSNLSAVTTTTSAGDSEKTLAVEGFANKNNKKSQKSNDVDVKVSVGSYRGGGRGSGNVMTSVDASLAQAENLKIAQQRILELEKEVEQLRAENEELASAGEIIRDRADELSARVSKVEKEKIEIQESAKSEILILKGNLQYKESEVAKARVKIDELDTRLKSDFKKIRVRERELENRLELLRAEKSALVRSKDEYILEQKRKIDQLSQELDNYREKCQELNKALEANQDQFRRTERALRLALTNLEAKEENLVPLKKAE